MKAIIFDASTLISFAMNGLLREIVGLKKIFKGKFIITKEVKSEVIDRPIKIKRFELEALKIQQLIAPGRLFGTIHWIVNHCWISGSNSKNC